MPKQKIQKPSFRETVTIMGLDDVGLSFNAQKVGPMNFYDLRKADYGEDFRIPTMPELVPLVYASLENQNSASARNVVKSLGQRWLAGNTGILYVQEGMYVQDNPNIRNQKVSMTKKTLQGKLGSHEEKGVVFSDDRSVRFTPYNFKRESQSALKLAKNTGIIALVGGEENAERLAKASKHWRRKPYFRVLSNVDSPQTRVAVLVSDYFDGRFYVVADVSEDFVRYSFGVRELSKL